MGCKRRTITPMAERDLDAALRGMDGAAQWMQLRKMVVDAFGIEGGISAAAKLGKDGCRQALLDGELPDSFGNHDSSVGERFERLLRELAVDEDKIKSIIASEIEALEGRLDEALKLTGRRVELVVNTVDLGTSQTHVHEKLPRALRKLLINEGVILMGPAGSFKSSGVKQMADMLSKIWEPQGVSCRFLYESLSYQTTEVRLKGFIDAKGHFQSTIFYDAYKNGGLYCLDEADAANPQILLALNGAIAAPFAFFGNGERVEKSPYFRIAATTNTFCLGADRIYVGRNQLDGATLDRFAKVVWGYDEAMERAIVLSMFGDNPLATNWLEWCHKVRHKAEEMGMKVVIATPRAVFGGAKELTMITPTPPLAEVEEDWVYNAVTPADARRLKGAL